MVVGRGGSVVGDRRRGGLWGHGFGRDQAGLVLLWWAYMYWIMGSHVGKKERVFLLLVVLFWSEEEKE